MNKYPGCDEIPVKLIMYAPDCVYESIAEIINQIASNGDFRREMYHCKNLGNQEDQYQTLDQTLSCLC